MFDLCVVFFSSCTHTAESSNNWWQAQLTNKAAVSWVKVYPRTDHHQSAIGGAEVNQIHSVNYRDTYKLIVELWKGDRC